MCGRIIYQTINLFTYFSTSHFTKKRSGWFISSWIFLNWETENNFSKLVLWAIVSCPTNYNPLGSSPDHRENSKEYISKYEICFMSLSYSNIPNILACNTFFVFLFNLFFYWRIIALRSFVVFCQTSTWISHRYTYTASLLTLPPTSLLYADTEPLFEFPETHSKFPLAIYFTYGNVGFHVTLSIYLSLSSTLPNVILFFFPSRRFGI